MSRYCDFFFKYCKNCRENFLNSCVFTKINIFRIIENPLLVKPNIGEILIVGKYEYFILANIDKLKNAYLLSKYGERA